MPHDLRLRRLGTLKVSRSQSRGPAPHEPHKPLMLPAPLYGHFTERLADLTERRFAFV